MKPWVLFQSPGCTKQIQQHYFAPLLPKNFAKFRRAALFPECASLIWTDRKQVLDEELGGYRSVEGPTPGLSSPSFIAASGGWDTIFLWLIQLPFFISISYNRFSILHCQQIQHNTEKKNWVKMTKMAMPVWTEILYLLASLTMNEHDPHSHTRLGSRM